MSMIAIDWFNPKRPVVKEEWLSKDRMACIFVPIDAYLTCTHVPRQDIDVGCWKSVLRRQGFKGSRGCPENPLRADIHVFDLCSVCVTSDLCSRQVLISCPDVAAITKSSSITRQNELQKGRG